MSERIWFLVACVTIPLTMWATAQVAKAQVGPCYVYGRPCYPYWMMPRYGGWYGINRNWIGNGPWGYPAPYYPNWSYRYRWY